MNEEDTGAHRAPAGGSDARAPLPEAPGTATVPGVGGVDLATFLRRFGALLLVAAASTFMLQRWDSGNDVLRYYLLLGLSALLTASAFVCGVRVGESRGARTFLALVLSTIPVHFAVLGGLVYSQFHLTGLPPELPAYANWVAPTARSALTTLALGVLALVPMVVIAMLALVRPVFGRYTLIFLAANALLLVPLRHVDWTALMLLGLAIGLVKVDLAHRSTGALRTFEGRLVRGLCFAPVLVMAGRTVSLYEPSSLFLGAVTMAASLALFVNAPRLGARNGVCLALQGVSAGGTLLGWTFVLAWLGNHANLPASVATLVYLLPYPMLLGVMSLWMQAGGRAMRRVALGVSCLVVNLNLIAAAIAEQSGPWVVVATLLALVVGVAAVAWGALGKSKAKMVLGAVTTLSGLGYHMWLAISQGALYNWGSLALLGIVLIFSAAYVERHKQRVAAVVSGMRQRLAPRTGDAT